MLDRGRYRYLSFISAKSCVYTASTYLHQSAREYSGTGATLPWVETDGVRGYTGSDTLINVGDMIGPGVKVHSLCTIWLVDLSIITQIMNSMELVIPLHFFS